MLKEGGQDPCLPLSPIRPFLQCFSDMEIHTYKTRIMHVLKRGSQTRLVDNQDHVFGGIISVILVRQVHVAKSVRDSNRGKGTMRL